MTALAAAVVGNVSCGGAQAKFVRNVCILAHVDHGKTTLADRLIASNGIISQRMAGKLRYMDSREDEQVRGITMKSSAISLRHVNGPDTYTINLIDSPGHIDFTGEVSTAVRLCDGAIVLVDAVEGVCAQTQVVLRQAWQENIKPVLVFNKIDRLIVELKLTPLEAYQHLRRVLEQVNVVMGTLFTADALNKAEQASRVKSLANGTESSQPHQYLRGGDDVAGSSCSPQLDCSRTDGAADMDDSSIYFVPEQGNVLFASAADGWAFRVDHFARLYAPKLGVSEASLKNSLWGDFYLNAKTKAITEGAYAADKKPLFVQLILENLWTLYEAVLTKRDKEKMDRIVTTLGVKVEPRTLHGDAKTALSAICSQWLPVSKAVLDAVVEQLPSPRDFPPIRADRLLCKPGQNLEDLPSESRDLKQAFVQCNPGTDVPTIVLVSKMFAVERKYIRGVRDRQRKEEQLTAAQRQRHLIRQRYLVQASGNRSSGSTADREAVPAAAAESAGSSDGIETANQTFAQLSVGEVPASVQQQQSQPESAVAGDAPAASDADRAGQEEDDDGALAFLAFARVFSGTLLPGQLLYVLGPKHDPAAALAKVAAGYVADPAKKLKDLDADTHITQVRIGALYTFMGRELLPVDACEAGSIVGIAGLEDHVLRSATLSNTVACPPFADRFGDNVPILRVALETTVAADMPRLLEGLSLLNQADPCVEVIHEVTGELVLAVAGEVHLQRCVDDLCQRYAKVKLRVSEPIVPFRETIVPPPEVDMVNEAIVVKTKSKRTSFAVEVRTVDMCCTLDIEAVPLPATALAVLERSASAMRSLRSSVATHAAATSPDVGAYATSPADRSDFEALRSQLEQALDSVVWPRPPPPCCRRCSRAEAASASSGSKVSCGCKPSQRAVDRVWSFGPRHCGPNLLFSFIDAYRPTPVWTRADSRGGQAAQGPCSCCGSGSEAEQQQQSLEQLQQAAYELLDSAVVSGFQLATASGPMCEEPMMGVAFVVSSWRILAASCGTAADKSEDSEACDGASGQDLVATASVVGDDRTTASDKSKDGDACDGASGQDLVATAPVVGDDQTTAAVANNLFGVATQCGLLSGQLISAVKDGCRQAFELQPQRLMMAMYTCTILATPEVLGKIYGVLGKRCGEVIGEDVKEGTSTFEVTATLPVAESFGFCEEFRTKTSGLAMPQLRFTHWKVLDIDPYWEPRTDEEISLYGTKYDSENRAKKYVHGVRKRKGLRVEEQLVQFAEKQRTLKKNK